MSAAVSTAIKPKLIIMLCPHAHARFSPATPDAAVSTAAAAPRAVAVPAASATFVQGMPASVCVLCVCVCVCVLECYLAKVCS